MLTLKHLQKFFNCLAWTIDHLSCYANINDQSGFYVSGAGDVNTDGFADVIIGAPSATGYGARSGVSYVVFGSNSTGLAGSIIDLAILSRSKAGFTINGANSNDRSGYSVSGAGDVNKDGFADVIIGAPYATGDASESGVSYVVFGGNSDSLSNNFNRRAELKTEDDDRSLAATDVQQRVEISTSSARSSGKGNSVSFWQNPQTPKGNIKFSEDATAIQSREERQRVSMDGRR